MSRHVLSLPSWSYPEEQTLKVPCYVCRRFTSPQHPPVISPPQSVRLEPHGGRLTMGDARTSGEMDMRNMIKIVTILALLSSRGVIAQAAGPARSSVVSSSTAAGPLSLPQHTRSIDEAPVGHRQPRARAPIEQSASSHRRYGGSVSIRPCCFKTSAACTHLSLRTVLRRHIESGAGGGFRNNRRRRGRECGARRQR